MTAFDKAEAERLIASLVTERRTGGYYDNEEEGGRVDGWNDALNDVAGPLADQLQAALLEIDFLTRRAQTAEIERDAMRPVAEACVRIAELEDVIVDRKASEEAREEADRVIGLARVDRIDAVAHYRKTADERDAQAVKLMADAPVTRGRAH